VSVLWGGNGAAQLTEDFMAIYIIRGERVTADTTAPAKLPKGSLIIRSAGEIGSSDLTACHMSPSKLEESAAVA
jgi:hypothetical protein